ncbi:RHS repeat-associated core domain-containing protein [Lacrimispora sphenoides]|uniref:RHS repeat-associated core domain-containing protein n=1 Tax=Lacrimispora sphenoides TaxID=29370 RepID=UPI0006CFD76D|nr:RHS repeat-associated core domain-containing protein [Lacrimispora sphenoides]SUY48778.1 RHS repeat-associated core domain-containing protein [Lacrimispora sphenoides]
METNNNVYSYNAEDYNPNLEFQYLRARYYDVEHGDFLTEDTYLGKLIDPLSLNRYNYVKSSPLNYTKSKIVASKYIRDYYDRKRGIY